MTRTAKTRKNRELLGVSCAGCYPSGGKMGERRAPCLQHDAPLTHPLATTETGGLVPS